MAPVAERRGLEPVLLDDLRERRLPEMPPGAFEAAVRNSWDEPDTPAIDGAEPNRAAQARGHATLLNIASRHPGVDAPPAPRNVRVLRLVRDRMKRGE